MNEHLTALLAVSGVGAAFAIWVGCGGLERRFGAPAPALPASRSLWLSPRTDILSDPVFRVGQVDDFSVAFENNDVHHLTTAEGWQRLATNYDLTEIK